MEQTSVEQSSVDSTQGESVPPVGSLGFRLYKEAVEPDRTAPECGGPGEGSGSSLHESRIESSRAEFESTTARERHRSWCPVHGKVQCTQEVASEVPAGGEPAEFIEYIEGGRVYRGQVTLSIVVMHNVDFPQKKNVDAKMYVS